MSGSECVGDTCRRHLPQFVVGAFAEQLVFFFKLIDPLVLQINPLVLQINPLVLQIIPLLLLSNPLLLLIQLLLSLIPKFSILLV